MQLIWRLGLTALTSLMVFATANAQANLAWARRYAGPFGNDDVGQDCAVDSAGNAYVTGSTVSSYDASTDTYRRDCILIKYDPAGNVVWQKIYGAGDTSSQEGVALTLDADGNVYVGGNQDWDYLTLKYDSQGTLLWARSYAGPGLYDNAVDIAVDPYGYVAITGSSDQGDFIFQNYLTLRYDSNGSLMWAIRYNGPGEGNDFARAVKMDELGFIYVTGYSEGTTTGFDATTIKYDYFGDPVWVQRYDYGNGGDDGGTDLIVDAGGTVFLTGQSRVTTNDAIMVQKLDPTGNRVWTRHYVGSSGGADSGRVLDLDASKGDVYVGAYSLLTGENYDYLTLKYNGGGTLLWSKRYDGPAHDLDIPRRLSVDAAGECYVAGFSAGTGTGWDYAVVKYSTTGTLLWAARYDGGSNLNDEATSLALGAAGALYASGCTQQSTNGPCDMTTVRLVQSKIISGTVTLQGWTASSAQMVAAIEIHNPGSGVALESGNAILDSAGIFQYPTNRASGTYDFYVQVDGWLRKKLANVVVGSNGASGLSFSLRNGDIDNDNEVGISDFALLSLAYNTFAGDPDWNAAADLNGDAEVSIGDYAILSSSYGLFGD